MIVKASVSLYRCDEYDYAQVERSVRQAVDSLGGIGKYVKPGQRVLLKINLLMKKYPDDAVTTHPSVVEAVVRLVQEAGAIPVIGDSPGGPYSEKALKGIYAASGMTAVAKKTGAELNWDVGEINVSFPEGKVVKSLTITSCCANADVIISLSKLKTHGMTTMTGSVKVMFGVIPGLKKAEYHFKMPNVEDFAGMLVDIVEYVNPSLTIMDAVVGMEGDGPSAGTLRKIGAVLASTNSYAIDVVGAHLIGLKPEEVPTIMVGRKRGFVSRLDELEVLGFSPQQFVQKGYKVPKTMGAGFLDGRVPKPVRDGVMKLLRAKPEFDYKTCVGCGDCVSCCPPEALEFNTDKRPVVDLEKCIRCFCCQELCPRKAVKIKRPWLARKLFS